MKSGKALKLTKTTVKAITAPATGYAITWDADLKGFGLLTTANGIKSYVVRARIKGKDRREVLGRADVLSTDKARELAKAWLGRVAEGQDPQVDRQRQRLRSITVKEALDRYAAKPGLAIRTRETIAALLPATLSDWLALPLVKIDAGMVERKHQAITQDTPGAASVAFRYFRAAWNLERISSKDSTGDYLLPPCPTLVLSEKKLWNHHARRQRAIAPHQFPAWFEAVAALPDPKGRAFFLFCLMTGCRKSEAAGLTWQDTDLAGRRVIFRQTKAGKHHADPDHHLPLPRQLVDLLTELQQTAVGSHVFGDALGRARGRSPFSHETTLIVERYGPFGPHDLRRSFICVAEGLSIPSLTTKKLVNHSTHQDVTGGYLVSTVESLRVPIQRIADQIDAYRLAADNVVTLKAKK